MHVCNELYKEAKTIMDMNVSKLTPVFPDEGSFYFGKENGEGTTVFLDDVYAMTKKESESFDAEGYIKFPNAVVPENQFPAEICTYRNGKKEGLSFKSSLGGFYTVVHRYKKGIPVEQFVLSKVGRIIYIREYTRFKKIPYSFDGHRLEISGCHRVYAGPNIPNKFVYFDRDGINLGSICVDMYSGGFVRKVQTKIIARGICSPKAPKEHEIILDSTCRDKNFQEEVNKHFKTLGYKVPNNIVRILEKR